eukprot:gene11926-biopygen12170
MQGEHGSAGGGFPCGTCQHHCTTNADELLENTCAAGKTAATPPMCDCKENPAKVHCDKCNLNYCDDCDAGTHARGARKAHVRITIEEHMRGVGAKSGGGEKVAMCPIHEDNRLTFFCKHDRCGTTICALCVARGHATHDYVAISEASGTSRQELEKVVMLAANALVDVSEGITAVNERRKEAETSMEATHKEVQQTYKQVQAGLIAEMKTTQADTLTEGGRKEGMLINQKKKLETVKEWLENGLELAHRLQEGASDVEFMQKQRFLIGDLTAATSHGLPVHPVCGPSVTFVKGPELMVLIEKISTLDALGAISGIDTNPAACIAEGRGLEEAAIGFEGMFVVTTVDFEGKKRESGGDGVALTVVFVDGGGDGGGGGGGGAAGVAGAGGDSGGGVENAATTVVDQKDGTYTCKYTLPEGSPEGECQLAVRILGQHIQGSPFAVQASAGKRFVHTGAFDGNGVLHWIGTGCGKNEYENPHGKPGGVVAKMSTVGGGEASRFVDHAPLNQNNYTNSTANSWMSVDLGEGRQLAPDYYCLRHGDSGGNDRLLQWLLEGSNDDSSWTLLKTHGNYATGAAGAFGAPAAGGGLFGATATPGGLFGGAPALTAAGSGLFGATATPGGLFGGAPALTAAGSGLFGAPTAHAAPGAAGGEFFGLAPAAGVGLPNQGCSTASWPIEAAADGVFYRYFRIYSSEKGSSNNYGISCAGIELYGILR